MIPNNFGALSQEYRAARRGYPKAVYDYLCALCTTTTPRVLDIGCGTGISTRELKACGFDVVGVDKDQTMVRAAQGYADAIQYIVAPAHQLPFPEKSFDIVTAFTAFHWFNDEESLQEMKRVLKPGGVFFAALKGNRQDEETRAFHEGYMRILKKYAGENFDSTKRHFDTYPLRKLFSNVEEKSFLNDERYSVAEALLLVQSLSLWHLVTDTDKPKLLGELNGYYEKNLIDGYVVRAREIFTLAGKKVDA